MLYRVYNILSHETEAEKIMYEDPDPDTGFIVIPDFKWDLVTMSALYLVAIVHSKDITSMRDLRKCHVEMLKKIRREAVRACQEKWGVGREGLKMFLHYQPSYCESRVRILVPGERAKWVNRSSPCPYRERGDARLCGDECWACSPS